MKKIVLVCFLFTGLSVFAQQQATFARNLESARVDEIRNNQKGKQFLMGMKEGQTMSESLFAEIAAAMEEKDGYVMLEEKDGKILLTVADFIEPKDAEDVMSQFGVTFVFINQVEYSFKIK